MTGLITNIDILSTINTKRTFEKEKIDNRFVGINHRERERESAEMKYGVKLLDQFDEKIYFTIPQNVERERERETHREF